MKTLEDIKQDMSDLYEDLKSGKTELKMAAELSNVAGKFLKAEAILLAREVFVAGFTSKVNVEKLQDNRKVTWRGAQGDG